ncbi:MAG TPA: hypothetical protein VKB46_23925 [Pyrinomonadaceae bacterium]|nr:hypothetical protein [Pyrinomonadaceae bacterium]
MAIRIVAAATLKLNVAMNVQSKRLYYIPVGRFSRGESRRTDGIRNKALFSDLHLLQRLIYVESEPYERQKEGVGQVTRPDILAIADQATEEDLLVYFVKHLVRITTKRNAFYVTLGVSRLLHRYSTLETMEIYNAVIGEPERVKDDYYYRSRKAVLMQEMYKRFGHLIRARRQQRGEERFETQPGSSELRSLVRECLRLFTPWDTQCTVPPDFDPLKSVIAALTSKNLSDENEVEVNRIHAVLHPDCFARLVAAFRYSPPADLMELPRFFSDQTDDQSPPRQRSAPKELSAEELDEINQMLDEQAGRRRHSSPSAVIRIIVDGIERGRLNPQEQSSISFSAEEDAEIIEVKSTDSSGDLLLATHLLTTPEHEAYDAAVVSSIRLEGGQNLSLSITRRQSEANGGADLLVQFGYRETDPRRAAGLWWRWLNLRLGREQDPNSAGLWTGAISARHVMAGSAVVICLASYFAYVTLRSPQTIAPVETGSVQTISGVNQPATQASNRVNEPDKAVPRGAKTQRSPATKAPLQSRAAAPEQARDEDVNDALRSGNVVANLGLKDIKKIYIEFRGDATFKDLRKSVIENLGSSGVVTIATNADEADAALKIVVSQTGSQIEAAARLVNAKGTVLWPKAASVARRYSGEPTTVASHIVNDLLLEIRRAHK